MFDKILEKKAQSWLIPGIIVFVLAIVFGALAYDGVWYITLIFTFLVGTVVMTVIDYLDKSVARSISYSAVYGFFVVNAVFLGIAFMSWIWNVVGF